MVKEPQARVRHGDPVLAARGFDVWLLDVRGYGRSTRPAAMDAPAFDARRVALASCFQKLRPEQRELVARRYEPEPSVNAMAEAAGTTAKAVSDRLRRIRHALLECIQKTLAEGAFA